MLRESILVHIDERMNYRIALSDGINGQSSFFNYFTAYSS